MTRLRARLESCRRDGRAAVVGYLPAGFPDRAGYRALVDRAFAAGLDALEVGLPGPAPPWEGSTIAAALAMGRTAVDGIPDALALAAGARARAEDALIVVAYDVVVDELGIDPLLKACQAAEIDSILLPQQSMRRQLEIARRARTADIDVVLFLARRGDLRPLTDTGLGDPIVYLQSATQHTGGTLNRDTALRRLGDVRSAFGPQSARILVGFGITSTLDAQVVARAGADGIVVGTAVVEAASDGPDDLEHLVMALRTAVAVDPAHTSGRPA